MEMFVIFPFLLFDWFWRMIDKMVYVIMVSVDAPRTGVIAYLVFCAYLTECFHLCLFYISLLLFPYVFCLN